MDLAVISAANSKLNSYLKTLNFEEYEQVGIDLKAVLTESGVSAHVYNELIEKPEPWSEASKNHPNLTNAIYQSLNEAMSTVVSTLSYTESNLVTAD